MKIRFVWPIASAILLAGCAVQDAEFPSLAPRAVERQPDEVEAPPAPSPVSAPPALVRDLSRLRAQASAGEKAFSEALPATERAVTAARGAEVSSEAWVAAQQALSNLDAARAPTAAALSELDSIFIALANAAASDAKVGGVMEAESTRAEAEQIHNRQIARLTALREGLSQP